MPFPPYLLDTCVCIPVLRGRATFRPLPAPAETAISSIVAAELLAGVSKLPAGHPQFPRLEEFLHIYEVVDFSLAAAQHYGDIRANLERKGILIGPLDLLIAAHARSLGATLITANVGEFRRVKGLKILAWK